MLTAARNHALKMQPRVTLAVFVAALAGCDAGSEYRSLAAEVDDLKAAVAEVRDELANAKKEIGQIQVERWIESFAGQATFYPGNDGYQILTFEVGKLPIQMARIEAYANGSKARFEIGNPLSATIDQVTAKVEWGATDENGAHVAETARSKEVIFSKPLAAGRWTYVDVVLDLTPPEKVGYVRVSEVNHKGLRMSGQ